MFRSFCVDALKYLTSYPTIAVIMAVFYGSLGAVLLGGAITSFIFDCPMLALISAIVSIYFWIESGRWAHWKDIHYHGSDNTSSKPPPKNLIKELISKVIK